MSASKFVYVTYIRTTPEKLWQALIEPEFTRQYWMASWQECSWEKGAEWKLKVPDRLMDTGEVLEIDPPKRLVLSWRNEFRPNLKEEGYSRMTAEIEIDDGLTKLTIVHEMDRPDSQFINAVSNGWPFILSSLKSLLETGKSLEGSEVAPQFD
jgi:uncharacterized protein YndB with AHSA1/START domain